MKSIFTTSIFIISILFIASACTKAENRDTYSQSVVVEDVSESTNTGNSSYLTERPDCEPGKEAINMEGRQCVGVEVDVPVEYKTKATSPNSTQQDTPRGNKDRTSASARTCDALAEAAEIAFSELGMPFTDIDVQLGSNCSVSGYVKACLDGLCYDPYEACPAIESGLRQGIYSIINKNAISAPIAIAEEPDKCLVVLFL